MAIGMPNASIFTGGWCALVGVVNGWISQDGMDILIMCVTPDGDRNWRGDVNFMVGETVEIEGAGSEAEWRER